MLQLCVVIGFTVLTVWYGSRSEDMLFAEDFQRTGQNNSKQKKSRTNKSEKLQ